MSNERPPQEPLSWNHTPTSVIEETEAWIKSAEAIEDTVSKIPLEDATFDNVLVPLIQNENVRLCTERHIKVYRFVSTSKELRDATNQAQILVNNFNIRSGMREDIYKLVEAVYHRKEPLDAESQYYLEKKRKGFLRNGLGLESSADRTHLKDLRTRIADLCTKCGANLNEESKGIWFSSSDLEGVPEDVINRLEKEGSGYRLTFKRAHLDSILQYARKSSIREKMFVANENKCLDNIPMFKEIILLRDEAARLLGYPNHAAYVIERNSLGKTPAMINGFLEDFKSRVAEAGKRDLERLRQLKKLQDDDDNFYLWDYPFYHRIFKEKWGSFDGQMVSEYFPLEHTLQGMLGIFERLFRLKFVRENVPTWHPSVIVYAIWSDEFLGYLYFDLFSRPGKHNHNTHGSLGPVRLAADGFSLLTILGIPRREQ